MAHTLPETMRKVSASVYTFCSASACFCMSTSSAQNLSNASRGSSKRSTSIYSTRASFLVRILKGTPRSLRVRSPNCAAQMSMTHSCSEVLTKTHSWGCTRPSPEGTLRLVLLGISSTVSCRPGCIANLPTTRPKLTTSCPANIKVTPGVAMHAMRAASVAAVQFLLSLSAMYWNHNASCPRNFSAGSSKNKADVSAFSTSILL
mmetsp:Transcript_75913/g.180434  ORF Transcript_75913/g.180434 Transcript_75913/m.180434 type:complete len:204 (+) Transcript_75913:119-730(+)